MNTAYVLVVMRAAEIKKLDFIFTHKTRWLIFIILSIGFIAILLQALLEWRPAYIPTQLIFLFFTSISILAIRYYFESLHPKFLSYVEELPIEEIDVKRKYNALISSRIGFVGMGMIYSFIAIISHLKAGIPWTGLVFIIYIISVAVNFFIIGINVWLYFVAIIPYFLSSIITPKVKSIVYNQPQALIVHNSLMRFSYVGIFLYLVGTIGVWLSPGSLRYFFEPGPIRQFWFFPFSILILIYTLSVHSITRNITDKLKKERLKILRNIMEESFDQWKLVKSNGSLESTLSISKMVEQIEKEHVWQLDLPKLTALVIPTFLPLIKEIVFPLLKDQFKDFLP